MADHRGFFILADLLFSKLFKKSQFIVDKVKKGESWKLVKEAFYLIEFVNPRNDPLCIALQHIVMHCTALPFYRNLVHSTVSWWIVLHHIRTWKLTFFLVCLTLGFLPNLLLLDSGSFSVFESSKLARLEVRVLRFPRPRPRPRKFHIIKNFLFLKLYPIP